MTHLVFNIRGTNGSGKSTIIRSLFDVATTRPLYGMLGPKRPEAYELKFEGLSTPFYIIGPYHTPAGGCDQVQPYDSIFALLDKYTPRGHVLFEGVIISSAYGRIGRYLEQFGKRAVLLFLNTPLDVCLSRINSRRQASPHNHRKPFNTDHVERKFRAIEGYKPKILQEDKVTVVDIASEDAAAYILEQIGGQVRKEVPGRV